MTLILARRVMRAHHSINTRIGQPVEEDSSLLQRDENHAVQPNTIVAVRRHKKPTSLTKKIENAINEKGIFLVNKSIIRYIKDNIRLTKESNYPDLITLPEESNKTGKSGRLQEGQEEGSDPKHTVFFF